VLLQARGKIEREYEGISFFETLQTLEESRFLNFFWHKKEEEKKDAEQPKKKHIIFFFKM